MSSIDIILNTKQTIELFKPRRFITSDDVITVKVNKKDPKEHRGIGRKCISFIYTKILQPK